MISLKKIKNVIGKYHLVLIILTGALVRLLGWRFMDYTNFPEFYRDYIMTEKIASGQEFVLLGPPSMLHHFHFGPVYYYIFVPLFCFFKSHPFSLILTGIIISLITIFFFYQLLLLWSEKTKLAAVGALLLALSLYAIHLTSYVSNPNFLPLFTIVTLFLLTKSIQGEAKIKDYFILGIALGVAGQLHATALLVLPLTMLISFVVAKKLPAIKYWLTIFAAAIFSYLPYLIYEFTHGFSNIIRLFSLGQDRLRGQNLILQIKAVTGFFSGSLTPFNYNYTYTYLSPNGLYIIIILAAVFCLVTAIYQIIRHGLEKKSETIVSTAGKTVLLSWAFVSLASLLAYSGPLQAHYLIILWPLPLITLVYGIFWIETKIKIMSPILLLIFIASLLQIYCFYKNEHVGWEQFYQTVHSNYKNRSGVEEIGS